MGQEEPRTPGRTGLKKLRAAAQPPPIGKTRNTAADRSPRGSVDASNGSTRMTHDSFDISSLTSLATQRNWRTPSEFPLCPDSLGPDPLGDYDEALEFGKAFSRSSYGESFVVVSEQGDELLSVLTRLAGNSPKEWALAKVVVERERFVHEAVGTFFTLQGALKAHCALAGVSLDESIDDCS